MLDLLWGGSQVNKGQSCLVKAAVTIYIDNSFWISGVIFLLWSALLSFKKNKLQSLLSLTWQVCNLQRWTSSVSWRGRTPRTTFHWHLYFSSWWPPPPTTGSSSRSSNWSVPIDTAHISKRQSFVIKVAVTLSVYLCLVLQGARFLSGGYVWIVSVMFIFATPLKKIIFVEALQTWRYLRSVDWLSLCVSHGRKRKKWEERNAFIFYVHEDEFLFM